MMRQVGTFNSVARTGYRAVRLPYEVRALGMVVVLPDAVDGLDDVSRRVGAQDLSQIFAALRSADASKRVDLALPRFKTGFKAELVKLFQEAGMRRAFDLKDADFSGVTGRPPSETPLAIGQIVHRAVIDVMEDGTEAAAATAITMVATSAAPSQPEVFRVDRPFLFYIVDDATGAILFQGRVVDPR
jgi:serine protease inhibitor